MATLTTGDWQRIGYYAIRSTSNYTTYVSFNARMNSVDKSARTGVVGTLLNIDVVGSGWYATDSLSAGMTGCTNANWGYHKFTAGTNTTILQGSFGITYDDAGNSSFNIQCWLSQTFGGNLSMQTVGCSAANIGAKVTHTASQPSINTSPNNSPNITAGQQCYIHCNQGSDSAIRHDVYYTIGSKTEYIKYDFQTNCTWTPSTDLCSLFPNANSMSGTIYLKSFVNGSLIGTKSCPFVLSVPSYTPSISINSVEETNSNVSAITSTETIQSLSSKTVTVSAGASYSASISGVWCNGVQLSYSNGKYVGTLSNMQTGTYSCSVQDSRGKTNSTSTSQTFYYYSPPTATASASRTSSTGSNGSISVTGTYTQIKSNTLKVTIIRDDSKQTDTATYTEGTSFSTIISYTDLLYTNTFSWSITIVDKFNQSITLSTHLGLGEYALWIGKKSIKSPLVSTGTIQGRPSGQTNIGVGWQNICNLISSESWDSGSFRLIICGYNIETSVTIYLHNGNHEGTAWSDYSGWIDCPINCRDHFQVIPDGNILRVWMLQYWNKERIVLFDQSGISITDGDKPSQSSAPGGDILGHYLLLTAYPVGSVYMSTSSTSPETLFGGSWSQIKDRFLVGAGSSYGAGSTGGSSSHAHTTGGHTLSGYEIPSHNHRQVVTANSGSACRYDYNGDGNGGSYDQGAYTQNYGSTWSHSHGDTGSSSHIPYYYGVYMWVRTA